MCEQTRLFRTGAAAGILIWLLAALVIPPGLAAGESISGALNPDIGPVLSADQMSSIHFGLDESKKWLPHRVSLAPAKWIWLPSQRTLSNTFVLFRKELNLKSKPVRATGWLTADSRYRLTVNGRRVQWGPAPCDPRQLDVDPMDVTSLLKPGKNVIGVEVLYYGIGEGTWVAGKPGLLFNAVIETADGGVMRIVSDESWQCMIDRAHPPAQPKRDYFRTLQEEFDARQHPYGWDRPGFGPDSRWVAAMVLAAPSDKPAACASGYDTTDFISPAGIDRSRSALRARQIPLTREVAVPVKRLANAGWVHWRRDPADWFDFRMPNSFEITRKAVAEEIGPGTWKLPATNERTGVFVTFELNEEIVGFPYFEIDAPAGTVIELTIREAHDPNNVSWLDSYRYAWTRFICREGTNRFEAFDYEALRWLQLHVHNAAGPVVVRNVGVRRRLFDWPYKPVVRCSEPALQRLFNASVNTIYNSAIETIVDGMSRERQQYSGDGGHQLLAIRSILGEPRISRRFLRTFSEGLTIGGYFMDTWPAYDRIIRLFQKRLDSSHWGPILDHGIGFNFDNWYHYLDTGDRNALIETYPRLVRFAEYLQSIRNEDGLLPVEGLGLPFVWIDGRAFLKQRHKQCAFNLYAAGMFSGALAPIAELFNEPERAAHYRQFSDELLKSTVRRFWSGEHGLFIDNLPWLDEEQKIRTGDRSLAMAVLFEQCPDGNTEAAVRELVECPRRMAFSYPCNAGWRLQALAKMGRVDIVLKDLRTRWATMRSIIENNTLQEIWEILPDSSEQFSHCAVVPLYVLAQDIAGIRPTAPGFARCQIRPQLGDLDSLELVVHTPRGPIRFVSSTDQAGRHLRLTIPSSVEAELVVPPEIAASISLPALSPDHRQGLKRFGLKAGQTNELLLTGKK